MDWGGVGAGGAGGVERGFPAQRVELGPRLASTAPATFSVKILSYGLNKSPLTKGDDILLRVYIAAQVALKAGDDELFSATYVGVASRAARADEILHQPDFIAAGRREAAQDFTEQLIAGLGPKLGKK